MLTPSAILNVVLLIVLLLALGLSGTAFGLFAHNNAAGICLLNYSDTDSGSIGNRKLCNASLAGYIIATICIAVATLIEFNRLVYGKAVNTIGKIIQIAIVAISGVFLFISGVSVAVGWAQTCKNLKRDNFDPSTSFSCKDALGIIGHAIYQELVGSAVCAFLAMIFTTAATLVAVLNAILTRNDSTDLEEKAPIM